MLALREAQLLPGLLGYVRQEPRASAILAKATAARTSYALSAFVATIGAGSTLRIELRPGGSRARLTRENANANLVANHARSRRHEYALTPAPG
jgi:hypothetical protein